MKSHRVHLLYGKTTCEVSLPEEYVIHEIHKNQSNPLADAGQALRTALQDPVQKPALSQIAGNARTVCILFSDITRPTPNGIVLPHVVAELEAAGISKDRVTILIATGIAHREAILTFHSPVFMEDPKACNCNLEGNPLHEDQLEIVSILLYRNARPQVSSVRNQRFKAQVSGF